MEVEAGLRGSITFLTYWEHGNTDLIGAEVGVYRGVHAATMLVRLAGLQHLYLVDPYPGKFAEFKSDGIANLSSFGDRKTWIHKRFCDCTSDDIPEPLDFVYIDGDHSYAEVKKDVKNAAQLVKPFGIVCGHDFQMSEVQDAVKEFCQDHEKYLRSWGGEWWFVNGQL